MGIYRLIILFLLGALTLQVEAQDEFVPIDGEPRIKVVFYKKVQKSPLYLSYILIQERLGILAARCALYITYSIRFEKK